MAYITKVGIIGPKPFALDGHDIDNSLRKNLRKEIMQILKEQDGGDENIVIGYTGLDIGAQQDFALVCNDLGIDYHCVKPFENQRESFFGMSEVIPLYDTLIERALSVTPLAEGNYAPKKAFAYESYLLENCDVVIFVHNKLREEDLLDHKKVIVIDVYPTF